MSKITSFALAGITALALSGGALWADTLDAKTDKPAPMADAKTDKPDVKADKPAAVAAPLTDESLKTMLENMGYEVKTVPAAGKAVIYSLTLDQDGWTFYVNVALSSDKEQMWISSTVATVQDEAKVPAAAVLRLLEESDNIGPSSVSYLKKSKQISVQRALMNRGGLTPAVIRTHLSQFMGDVMGVQKLCDFTKPQEKVEAKTDAKADVKTDVKTETKTEDKK